MKPLPRLFWMACACALAGCSLPDPKREAAAAQERLLDDNDQRKERLRTGGTLSPQEYDAMARKLGWTTKGAPGLPPPPATEELEKRVREAETKR